MRKTLHLCGFFLLYGTAIAPIAGCAGDDCLVDGENCTTAYVESEYGDDRDCCDGLSCSSGAISGVLICQ